MNNKKVAEIIRMIALIVAVVLMIVSLVYQLFAIEQYVQLQILLRSGILIMTSIIIVIDIYLKELAQVALHICWWIIWLFNLCVYLI